MLLKQAIERYGNYLVDEEELKGILKPHGRYIPKVGDRYWFLSMGGVIMQESNYEENSYFLKHHLAFRTEEECEEYKRYVDLLDKLSFEADWKDSEQKKFGIRCARYGDNKCLVVFSVFCDDYGVPVFESKREVEKFIKEVGYENVKKFMFNIWD